MSRMIPPDASIRCVMAKTITKCADKIGRHNGLYLVHITDVFEIKLNTPVN